MLLCKPHEQVPPVFQAMPILPYKYLSIWREGTKEKGGGEGRREEGNILGLVGNFEGSKPMLG